MSMNKILLIEDDPIESRLYQRLFTQEGFELVVMENGQNCRQKALKEKPDIILLDIMMPQVNGFESLDLLRTDPETKKIPIIMFSNLSDNHYAEESIRRGAVKYIIKSQVENKELVRIINDIIRAYKKSAI